MAKQKTKPTGENVEQFLNAIPDERKRQDSLTLLKLMKQVTRLEPEIWAGSMVGFGRYHYKYASGHEGDTFLVGFSPRKDNLAVYILPGLDQYDALLNKLGKYKTGKSCFYLKRLDDVDLPTLKELVAQSYRHMRATNK